MTDPTPPTGLLDVTNVALAELFEADDDTVLAAAIRRVTAPAEQTPRDAVSAFNSAI